MGNKHPTYCPPPPSNYQIQPCVAKTQIALYQGDIINPSTDFSFNDQTRVLTFHNAIANGAAVPIASYTMDNNGNTAANTVVGTFSTPISTQYKYQYFVNKLAVPTGSPVTSRIGDTIDLYVIGPIPQNATITLPSPEWVTNSPVVYCNIGSAFVLPVTKDTPNAILSKRC